MRKDSQPIDGLYEEMVKKGLLSASNLWIEKAIVQNPAKMTLGIASSRLFFLDRLDRKLITREGWN